MDHTKTSEIILLYDGKCPFCSSYVRYYRLKDAASKLTLLDARDDSQMKTEITEKRWDLDKGMVLKVGTNYYFGSDAMYMLALMSTHRGWLNRLNIILFGSRWLAKLLYPLCKACRWVALRLLGIADIGNLET